MIIIRVWLVTYLWMTRTRMYKKTQTESYKCYVFIIQGGKVIDIMRKRNVLWLCSSTIWLQTTSAQTRRVRRTDKAEERTVSIFCVNKRGSRRQWQRRRRQWWRSSCPNIDLLEILGVVQNAAMTSVFANDNPNKNRLLIRTRWSW